MIMEDIKVAKVHNVQLTKLSHQFNSADSSAQSDQPSGSLLITPHHLVWSPSSPANTPVHHQFSPSDTTHSLESPATSYIAGEDVWIAHSLLTAVQHLPRLRQPTLLIRLATFVFYTLSFSSPSELDDVWDSLKALVSNRKPGEKESLYAFIQAAASTSKKPPSEAEPSSVRPGWDIYDPHAEFARMQVIGDPSKTGENSAWRLTSINSNFNFCSTYPSLLLIPSKISDTTLTYAVKYRSKGRLPIGTYVHWANGSSITRSSQPMVGFKNARSIQDEKLIEAIFHSHSLHTGPIATGDQATQQVVYGATSSNLIIDARPTTNAMANTVKGAGTENMEYYKGCRKAYLGIDNIHVMRDSLNKVVAAIHESFVTGTPVSSDMLKRSGWLKHIAAVLEGTNLITRTVHVYNSHVLIHCSDGWDRTSQLSALSQVCLDPYYRTFKGFAVLVEKDWLSVGHKFSDRSGIVLSGRERVSFGESPNHSNYSSHLEREESEETGSGSGAWVTSIQKQLNFGHSVGSSHAFKETSPVFHQFLDCVYQLQRQYAQRFEFNSSYLERLHEELHAGTYGTFLFDCEKERMEAKAAESTCSVWQLFLPPNDLTRYRNPQYDGSLDDPTDRKNTDQGVLYPDVKDIIFWWEIFGCSNEEMNPPKPPESSEFTHVDPISCRPDDLLEKMDKTTVDQVANSKTPHRPRASTGLETGSPQPEDMSSLGRVELRGGGSGQAEGHGVDPLQNAFQQAKIMGWSTWDRLKKGYKEVASAGTASHPASPRVYHHPPAHTAGSPGPSHQDRARDPAPPLASLEDDNPWTAPGPPEPSLPPAPSPRPQRPSPVLPAPADPWRCPPDIAPPPIDPRLPADPLRPVPASSIEPPRACRPAPPDIDPLGVGFS